MPAAVNGMKKCSRCGEVKPVCDFHKNKSTYDGYTGQCKICVSLTNKRYRAINHLKIIARKQEYREKNKEEINSKQRQRYSNHKEEILEQQKEYREKNKEKISERVKKYYESHENAKARYRACLKKPSCPAVGGRGAEFVILTCPICGAKFRVTLATIDGRYKERGQTVFYCSRECSSEAIRKSHKSEYEKNIKRIRKEQKL